MLAKPGTEEGPPVFCSMKQLCADGMLSFEEKVVTMTSQEWKIWITLLQMIPPVEIQGQRVAGTAHVVDLQALDGSCFPCCLFGNCCLSKQCELGQAHPVPSPSGTGFLSCR